MRGVFFAVAAVLSFNVAGKGLELTQCGRGVSEQSVRTNPYVEKAQREESFGLSFLKDLVSIRSTSRKEGEDPGMMEGAEKVASYVRQNLGFTTEIARIEGSNPFVIAQRIVNPEKPTVFFYTHYDVVPEGKPGTWRGNPFEMRVEGDRIFGRGVVDNKGGTVATLEALRAFMSDGQLELPYNIILVVEGEEEIGSPRMEALLKQRPELFKTVDLTVILDSANIKDETPTITSSLRGSMGVRVTATGAKGQNRSHAGVSLISALGSMYRLEDGTITIPGFYDDVIPAVGAELETFQRYSPTDVEYRASANMTPSQPIMGRQQSPLHFRLARESSMLFSEFKAMDITGLGGPVTISAEASATLEIELSDNSDHQKLVEILESYLQQKLATVGMKVAVKTLARPQASNRPLEVQVTVSGIKEAIHSGLHGNVAPNAGTSLIIALGSLFNLEDGSVTVPGFAEAGGRRVLMNEDEATSTLALRLAPGTDAEKMLPRINSFLKEKLAKAGLKVTTEVLYGRQPWSVSVEHPIYRLAGDAMARGFKKPETVVTGFGGTIPLTLLLDEHTNGAPMVLMGIIDSDSNIHGPNECLHLETYRGSRDGLIYLLDSLRSARRHP